MDDYEYDEDPFGFDCYYTYVSFDVLTQLAENWVRVLIEIPFTHNKIKQ